MHRSDPERPYRRAAFDALARQALTLEVQFTDRQAADTAIEQLDDSYVCYTIVDGIGWEMVPPKLVFKFPDVISMEMARNILQ